LAGWSGLVTFFNNFFFLKFFANPDEFILPDKILIFIAIRIVFKKLIRIDRTLVKKN